MCLFSFLACKKENIQKIDLKNNTKTNIELFYGGDIITMDGNSLEYAEAVVQENGTIVFVGNKKEAINKYPYATRADLSGKTLIPGFIEPHLHPSLAAVMLQNEIIAPYDWELPSGTKKGVTNPKAYIKQLTESIKNNANKDKVYFVWGYHQLWHGELSRTLLNKIAGDQPVGIIHRSFHEIYLNDAAISKLKITESEFKQNSQVNWDKGHFYEGGWLALVPKLAFIILEPKSYLEGLATMSEILKKNGITTIAEPGFPSSNFDAELQLLQIEMKKNPPYDVYLIPNGTQLYGMKGGNKEALEFIRSEERREGKEWKTRWMMES